MKGMYMPKYVLFLFGIVCPFFHSSASDLVEKYAAHNAVITNLEYEYVIDVKGDSLYVTQTNTKEVQLINDYSKGFTKDYIYFSGFTSISEKEAYTLIPKGDDDFEKVKVEQFKETGSSDGSVFYDDSKMYQFAYPSLQKGASTYLKYTIKYNNPRFLRTCFLQSYLPVNQVKIKVKVHRDVELGYKLFNTEKTGMEFNKYTKGKYTYYEWNASDMEPYPYTVGEYYTISYFSPHIMFYILSTHSKGNEEKYFGSPDLLYQYYYDFVKGVNDHPSDALKKLVVELTEGLNDQQKAKAIYYWVHDHIKYVAYEHGYAGFIPASASEVEQKRYGDCKGMSSLIKTMMDLAGLPAYYTWVGTRHIPYTYEQVPLPSVDNHMIASRMVGDSLILLDGTFKYLDYGVYPYHIQGKEVLVGKGPNDFEIVKVPVSPASYSVITDSSLVRMEDGIVKGQAKAVYTGFSKLELAYTMDGVKTDDYNKTYSRIFNKGNNKFKVTKQETDRLFDYDVPAEIKYDFEIGDYYKQMEDEIYINLNLDKPYQNMLADTTGTINPIQNDFYCIERYVTRFQIPPGYKVTYMPKEDAFSCPDFSYSLKYRKEGDFIVLDKELVFDFFMLLEDKLPQWNNMIKSLNKNYRRTLVLKKMSE